MNVQGVNREFDELKKEYCNKWVLESGMPPSSLLLVVSILYFIAYIFIRVLCWRCGG